MSDSEYWLNFFESAGLPMRIASQYAKTFVDNRLRSSHLSDIDKSVLKEMGISAIGDILAVLKQIEKEKEKIFVEEQLHLSNRRQKEDPSTHRVTNFASGISSPSVKPKRVSSEVPQKRQKTLDFANIGINRSVRILNDKKKNRF